MNNHNWTRADRAYKKMRAAIDDACGARIEAGEAMAEFGAELQALRDQYPSDRAFGMERRERYPDLPKEEPSRLMRWSQIPQLERLQVYEKSEAATVHSLIQAHRLVCHDDKPPNNPRKVPANLGWIDAVTAAGAVWAASTIGRKKRQIEDRLGWKIPRILPRNDPRIIDIVTAIESLAKGPTRQSTTPLDLKPSEEQKFARAVERELKRREPEQNARIESLVEAKVASLRAEYERKLAALRQKEERLEKKEASLRKWQNQLGLKNGTICLALPESEWKSLRQLLHPDREPDRERMSRAFTMINAAVLH